MRSRREVIDFGHRLPSFHSRSFVDVRREKIGLLSRRKGRERSVESRLWGAVDRVVVRRRGESAEAGLSGSVAAHWRRSESRD